MFSSRPFILSSTLLFALGLPWVCITARSQAASSPDQKLNLNAVVVLDQELCATKIKKNHESFEVGKAACDIFKSALGLGFSRLTSAGTASGAADAQAVLIPRFVDLSATKTMGAFSTRELTILLEWTVKDKTGRTVWIGTVQGTGKNHMGNGFTYKTDLREIIHYALEDLAHKSVADMDSSPELNKFAQKVASTQ